MTLEGMLTQLDQLMLSYPIAIPILSSVHLLAVTLLAGTVLVVDLRLLGLGLINHSVATLQRSARGWFFTALALLTLSGVPLWRLASESFREDPAVQWKIILFLTALTFALLVHGPVVAGAIRVHRGPRPIVRVVGVLSLLLWFGTLAAGAWSITAR